MMKATWQDWPGIETQSITCEASDVAIRQQSSVATRQQRM